MIYAYGIRRRTYQHYVYYVYVATTMYSLPIPTLIPIAPLRPLLPCRVYFHCYPNGKSENCYSTCSSALAFCSTKQNSFAFVAQAEEEEEEDGEEEEEDPSATRAKATLPLPFATAAAELQPSHRGHFIHCQGERERKERERERGNLWKALMAKLCNLCGCRMWLLLLQQRALTLPLRIQIAAS